MTSKLLILFLSFTLANGMQLRSALQQGHAAAKNRQTPQFAEALPMDQQPEIDMVVARYDEDISWVKDIHRQRKALNRYGIQLKPYNVLLYNKGQDNIPKEDKAGFHESFVHNVPAGREGHTFLRHIIERYDTLAEWTVFLQGEPFQHAPSWMPENLIKFGQDFSQEKELQCLSCQYNATVPYKDACASGPRVYGIKSTDLQVAYPKPFFGKGVQKFVGKVAEDVGVPPEALSRHFMQIMDIPFKDKVMDFCFGATMVVHKNRIHRLPKEKWQRLWRWFMNDTATGDAPELNCESGCRAHPYRGYIIERMWFELFGSPGLPSFS